MTLLTAALLAEAVQVLLELEAALLVAEKVDLLLALQLLELLLASPLILLALNAVDLQLRLQSIDLLIAPDLIELLLRAVELRLAAAVARPVLELVDFPLRLRRSLIAPKLFEASFRNELFHLLPLPGALRFLLHLDGGIGAVRRNGEK
ncbi:MAG TPA: hypothetical protein VNN77_08535 [candidate division Zixibacteria bacterium]|nr:hypothetical protein [candidate division Zixibacteria bacterium]